MEMTLLSLVVAIVGVIPIFLAQASIIPLSVGVICFLAVALIGIYGLFRYMTRLPTVQFGKIDWSVVIALFVGALTFTGGLVLLSSVNARTITDCNLPNKNVNVTSPNCIETVSYSQGPFTLVGVIGGVATLLLLFSIFVFSIMVVIAYYLSGKKTSDPRP